MSETASIGDIVTNVRHAALGEAELAVGACSSDLPKGLFEPTVTNRRIWSVAHAAGVMAACRAIRKLRENENGCGNG